MFSYVDFGFMLDFIVFIMRSVFSGVRGIRDVRADINSPLFCLTDRERLFTNTLVPQLISLC